MSYDRLESLILRVFIFGALALLALGAIERPTSVLDNSSYLIELAVALTLIVIALLLRQIRDQLRKD
jgi:hypothetical protein